MKRRAERENAGSVPGGVQSTPPAEMLQFHRLLARHSVDDRRLGCVALHQRGRHQPDEPSPLLRAIRDHHKFLPAHQRFETARRRCNLGVGVLGEPLKFRLQLRYVLRYAFADELLERWEIVGRLYGLSEIGQAATARKLV
jgi:hypothetical protein